MIELREALAAGDYTVEGLRSVLGRPPDIGMEHDRDVFLRRLGHAEQGSHEELMKREGIYYYLVSQQLTL